MIDWNDIHERRLETRRQAALDRLRSRRSWHCEHCGYRSFQSVCPRCGELCEPRARPPS